MESIARCQHLYLSKASASWQYEEPRPNFMLISRFRCGAHNTWCTRGVRSVRWAIILLYLSRLFSELTAAVEKYSGSSSASFQGTGHKLGDGKKTSNPVVADPRGAFNLNSEIGTLALIVLGYAALMAYTYYS